MSIVISDASVLIDIECGRLTKEMFSLSLQFAVPDILFDEELKERHGDLLKLGLIIRSMSGDLIGEAYALHQKYSRPSVNDMLALTLAKHEGCQLLTGDKALRVAAGDVGVEVHGTIWLVREMLKAGKITTDIAQKAFKQMREAGSRLPWGQVGL